MTDKQSFPIKTKCSACGHAGELYITDATVGRDLEAALRGKMRQIYGLFLVRRFVALVAGFFLLGFLFGWWMR